MSSRSMSDDQRPAEQPASSGDPPMEPRSPTPDESKSDGRPASPPQGVPGEPEVPPKPSMPGAVDGSVETETATEAPIPELAKLTVTEKDEANGVRQALSWRQRTVQTSSDNADLLIVTALRKEFDAFSRAFDSVDSPLPNGESTWWPLAIGTIRAADQQGLRVAVMCTEGAGAQRAILPVNHAVESYRPAVTVLGGIAAGNPATTKMLDIVVSDQIIAIDWEKRGESAPHGVPTHVKDELVGRLRRFAERERELYSVIIGGVISQNNVVKDRQHRDDLFRRYPQAQALEMEGGALVQVAGRMEIVTCPVIIKAIVDFADIAKDKHLQEKACNAVAEFVRGFVFANPIRSAWTRPATDAHRSHPDETTERAELTPRPYLARTGATFVAPDNWAALKDMLDKKRVLILCGPDQSGRRSAAVSLLAGLTAEVHEIEPGLDEGALRAFAPQNGQAYLLKETRRHVLGSDALGALVDKIRDLACYLVIYSNELPTRITGRLADHAVDWHLPIDGKNARTAVERNAAFELQDDVLPALDALLKRDDVLARVNQVKTREELLRLARALRGAASQAWDDETLTSAMSAIFDQSLRTRVSSLEIRPRSWFIAAGVAGKCSVDAVAELAIDLETRLSNHPNPTEQPAADPFAMSIMDILESLGVTELDGETRAIEVPGLDTEVLLDTLWQGFPSAHEVLLAWFSATALSTSMEAASRVASAVGRLAKLAPETVLHLVEAWAETTETSGVARHDADWRPAAIVDIALTEATKNGVDTAEIMARLRGWLESGDVVRILVAAAVLSADLGETAPEAAVRELARVARRDDDELVPRAAQVALARALVTDATAPVVGRLLMQWCGEVVALNEAQRLDKITTILGVLRVLANVDLDGSPNAYRGRGLSRPDVITSVGNTVEQLVRMSLTRSVTIDLIAHWAKRAHQHPDWRPWLVDLMSSVYRARPGLSTRAAIETALRQLSAMGPGATTAQRETGQALQHEFAERIATAEQRSESPSDATSVSRDPDAAPARHRRLR